MTQRIYFPKAGFASLGMGAWNAPTLKIDEEWAFCSVSDLEILRSLQLAPEQIVGQTLVYEE